MILVRGLNKKYIDSQGKGVEEIFDDHPQEAVLSIKKNSYQLCQNSQKKIIRIDPDEEGKTAMTRKTEDTDKNTEITSCTRRPQTNRNAEETLQIWRDIL